ncbi:MAG: BamA/TamA family outer membrane protein [Ginsengibacter sp.]
MTITKYNRKIKAVLAIIFIVSLFSCNNTKHLPAGDALYTGAKVTVKEADLSRRDKNTLQDDLEKLTRPRPNSKFLGIPFKLSFYNFGGKPGNRKGLGGFIRKLGEPPVLLSDFDLDHNTKLLQNYLENKGFFKAVVTGDTVVRRKRARANFSVKARTQYKIKTVTFQNDSSDLEMAIKSTSNNTLLIPGAPFNLDLLKGERDRVDAALKEMGYYYFSPDYILIDADSSIGDHKVNLYITVKNTAPYDARRAFKINDIFIYSNYNLATAAVDTTTSNIQYYKGYYVIDKNKMYKPQLFEKIMLFRPGELYSRSDHNTSLSRFINLGVYKFVKNRFEQVPDSAKLNAFYYLTPLPVHNISAQVSGNTKSNSTVGSLVTFRWTDKNIAHRANILSVHASVGSEVQYLGNISGINTFTVAGGINYAIPYFVVPFFKVNTTGEYVPKTNISFEYSILDRTKLYALNSFRGELGYIWKPSIKKEHRLNPISIDYVQPLRVTKLYDSIANKNPALRRTVRKQFIIGSNYNFTYDELTAKPKGSSGWFFIGNIDLSGNLLGLFSGANAKAGKTYSIFGTDFSQYIRTETDVRRYIKVGLKNTWANRFDLGIGVPYGNSLTMPYIKQFFVGGNNSVRAFRSRSVGPGTYRAINADSSNYYPDQAGDIKLEMNTEFRMRFNSILEGAAFIDAGNVWLFNNDPLQPGGKFTNKFLSQLAIGAGIGVRFDLQILLLRLDLATPVREPWLAPGHQFVLNQFNLGSKSWRRQNLVLNLAIGYPF